MKKIKNMNYQEAKEKIKLGLPDYENRKDGKAE